MAPIPDGDDNHYDAGAPLDGGSSPAVLAGSDKHYSPTGLEIGVITGVVVLVILTVIGLFVWRSRKNRAAKDGETGAGPYTEAGSVTTGEEARAQRTSTHDTRDPQTPPKDGFTFASTVKNDDLSSLEHPAVRATNTPATNPAIKWSAWATARRGATRDGAVEEHEIANRV
ncbi:hypothetical protein F4819DRAFT_273645 [Hypoxylon fuscum]|nr:hypothetical protein F4819DRAFT_273645 [Hypoxylon fuscum]